MSEAIRGLLNSRYAGRLPLWCTPFLEAVGILENLERSNADDQREQSGEAQRTRGEEGAQNYRALDSAIRTEARD